MLSSCSQRAWHRRALKEGQLVVFVSVPRLEPPSLISYCSSSKCKGTGDFHSTVLEALEPCGEGGQQQENWAAERRQEGRRESVGEVR